MKINPKLVQILVISAALVLPLGDASAQQAGRVAGTVIELDGTPIADVTITISAPGMKREMVKTSNKKGKFTVSHSDAAMTYEYRFEKPGYQTLVLPVSPPVGDTAVQDFTLLPASAAPQDAEVAAAGAVAVNPAVRTYNEGVEALRTGDLETAAEAFRKAAELDSDLAAAHTSLAAVLLQREDYETAAAEAEKALAIDPNDVRALQVRFDAYRLAGDQARADEAAQALREIGNLTDAAARIFNEGVDSFNAGDLATAQSKFQQVIELDPEMVQPYVALAQISLNQGGVAEAAAMAKAALERDPDNTRALKIAYDGARLTGDDDGARQALDRLVELDPEWVATALFDHAATMFNNNQPEVAALELEYVLKADPELARAHYLLGMSYFNSGKVEEGRAHLERFIELAPEDPDAEIARGLLAFEE